MSGFYTSVLLVLVLVSGITCQTIRNMFTGERKFAPCKYTNIKDKDKYLLAFHIYTPANFELCKSTSIPTRNSVGLVGYFQPTKVSSKVTMVDTNYDYKILDNDAGFEISVKSSRITDEMLSTFCYVCDQLSKDKLPFLSEPSRINLYSFKIRVLDPPKILSFTPNKDKINLKLGASMTLQCSAKSSPVQPNVQILKKSTGRSLASKSKLVTYTISKATKMDTGVYQCKATTNDATLLNAGKNVATKDKDIQVVFKPKFVIEKIIRYTTAGVNEKLKVQIDANPKPVLECMLANKIQEKRTIEYDAFDNYHRFTVVIPKVKEKDIGSYKCKASNDEGTAMLDFTLKWKPGDVVIHSDNSTDKSNFYVLQWEVTTHKGAPITSYKIIVKYKNKNKWSLLNRFPVEQPAEKFNTKTAKLAWHHTGKSSMLGTHHVYGLRPNTEHQVSVVAKNKHGESEIRTAEFKTPENNTNTFQDPDNPDSPVATVVHCKPGDSSCKTGVHNVPLFSTLLLTILLAGVHILLRHL